MQVLQRDSFIFADIHDLLQQQFNRLTGLEQQILYWLAINREPVTLQELQQDFINPIAPRILLQSLASLQKRSLIEKSNSFWGLQTVVMEYVTYELILKTAEEINIKNINLLNFTFSK
ncbi:MAG: hypothetical protein HC764_22360 [Pleurocapsa sp. CRU_1_2]|nr:hypothetical protein [Pleurocapsa sp. CRU_1_2]